MKRIFWQVMIVVLFAIRLSGQPSLQFFTNQANALLESSFGFGVGNIPVYCSTNSSIGYSASLHYLLQSAANNYDANTPASNFHSVFRPLFGWSSNTLFIVGYTNVATDFYTQTARGFKEPSDSTICTNDNVWGIPWVVGEKNNPPAFNKYCYDTALLVERRLLFVRLGTPENFVTNRPPAYTNQIFIMSISNAFAMEAWNYNPSNYPDGVTIVASNQVMMTLTNNYDWGTNFVFSVGTNEIVNAWPAWTGRNTDASFLVPLFTNVISLPLSYWSESTAQVIPITNFPADILPSDLQQMGFPVHNWVLTITNNLTCGILDNSSGQVLDFVNLGGLGSSIQLMQPISVSGSNQAWNTNGATEAPNSPISEGVMFQIETAEQENQALANSLSPDSSGLPVYPYFIFGDGDDPINVVLQSCTWQSGNPIVHYTLQDLNGTQTTENIPGAYLLEPLSSHLSNPGGINTTYNPGLLQYPLFEMAGIPHLSFQGFTNLPYAIWASSDLLNWSQIGTATQVPPIYPRPYSSGFQFTDLSATNYPMRFYQVRLP